MSNKRNILRTKASDVANDSEQSGVALSESFFEQMETRLIRPLEEKLTSLINEKLNLVADEARVLKISREQLEEVMGSLTELHLKMDNAFTAPGTGGKVATAKSSNSAAVETLVDKLENPKKAKGTPNNMQWFRGEYTKNGGEVIFHKTYVPEEGGEPNPKLFMEALFKEHALSFKDKKTAEAKKKQEASILWKYGMTKDQKARIKEYQKDIAAKNQMADSKDAKPDIVEDEGTDVKLPNKKIIKNEENEENEDESDKEETKQSATVSTKRKSQSSQSSKKAAVTTISSGKKPANTTSSSQTSSSNAKGGKKAKTTTRVEINNSDNDDEEPIKTEAVATKLAKMTISKPPSVSTSSSSSKRPVNASDVEDASDEGDAQEASDNEADVDIDD